MKILACGSRSLRSLKPVQEAFDRIDGAHTLIEGNAMGADRAARLIAQRKGWEVITVPADWEIHGKAAGPIRNQKMLDMEPDLVIAFWDGQSKGTKDMITRAEQKGVEVRIVRI